MKEALIDVRVEMQVPDDLQDVLRDKEFWMEAIRRLRHEADELAATVGGVVRTDRKPQFLEPRLTSHVLVPGQFVLFASRWHVDVPDSFHLEAVVRSPGG